MIRHSYDERTSAIRHPLQKWYLGPLRSNLKCGSGPLKGMVYVSSVSHSQKFIIGRDQGDPDEIELTV